MRNTISRKFRVWCFQQAGAFTSAQRLDVSGNTQTGPAEASHTNQPGDCSPLEKVHLQLPWQTLETPRRK